LTKTKHHTIQGDYASPDFYTSVTKSVHVDPKTGTPSTQFKTEFKLQGGLKTKEEQENYIATWTKENASTRNRRFRTTMNGVQVGKPGGRHGETKQLSLDVER
jgi:hypothetical protein